MPRQTIKIIIDKVFNKSEPKPVNPWIWFGLCFYKMTNMLMSSFHVYYSKQLNQLPWSIKIDIWRRLTSRQYPLSLEQASNIHPEVEDLLNQAVKNYIKKKERQRMKPNTSKCKNLLSKRMRSCVYWSKKWKKRLKTLVILPSL